MTTQNGIQNQVKVEEVINPKERAMNKMLFKASLFSNEEISLVWEAANGKNARPHEGMKIPVLNQDITFDWKEWLSVLYHEMEKRNLPITGEFRPLSQFNIIQPREKQEVVPQTTDVLCPQHNMGIPCSACAEDSTEES